MNSQQISTIDELCARSLAGTIAFPEVVGRLIELGVERYHVDYCRQEGTYYLPDGASHVVKMPHPPHEIAADFSAADVEGAIRSSQRGEITYLQFVERTMAAGCVGYFVHITGRCALYFGRRGDVHVEPFPQAPRP